MWTSPAQIIARLDRRATSAGRSRAGPAATIRARTPDVGDFETTMAWLDEHQPPDRPHVLVHGDFRLDNVVLGDDLQPRAVLDWELATIGDPLMDLGSSLAYWVQADDHPMMLGATKRQPSDAAGHARPP